MFKKYKYLIIAALASVLLGFSAPYFWNVYHYLPFKKKEIHIFFETYATAPAFSHIIAYAQLPKETK